MCSWNYKHRETYGSGVRFSKVPKLFRRISDAMIILFVSSQRSRLEARSFAVIFGTFEKRAAVPEKAIRLSLFYNTFWKHPHWRAAPQIPLPDNLNWLSHQVHSHGFYNFKKILSQLFRFLKCFLAIGYNHFNLSFVFQANCDHVRKSKIEGRTKQKTQAFHSRCRVTRSYRGQLHFEL